MKIKALIIAMGLACSPFAAGSDAVWTVKPGNTLTGIAKTFQPQDDEARIKLEQAIVTANPTALQNGSLVVGAKLVIPGEGTDASVKIVKAATPVALAATVPADVKLPPATTPVPLEHALAEPKQEVRPVAKKRAAVALPGIGKIAGTGNVPGDDAMFNATVIHVKKDRNELAYISSLFPNRIATPFKAPRVINNADMEEDAITAVDSSLYVAAGFSESTGVFITGSEPGDPVISLTLVPKPMPQQTITLVLDAEGSSTAARKDKQEASSYTGTLVERFRLLASGKIPAGFTETGLPNAVGRNNSMLVIPESRFSGRDVDIFRYRIENVSTSSFELSESSFYQDGVLGVAIFPEITLRPGQYTYVLVASDKKLAGGE